MGISVRLFTQDELNRIVEGKDEELLTIFINKTTFNKAENEAYHNIPVILKLNYVVSLDDDIRPFKAPNDKMARWFINQEYFGNPPIHEVTTHYRKVA